MSWIKSYGIALPHFRIGDTILHPNGKSGVSRAISFSDEDIISLAFEASADCLEKYKSLNINSKIDGVLFATSTPVFNNRYHASFLADLLNLPKGILAIDFVNSSRGGTDAFFIANELIESGRYSNILVVATDVYFPSLGEETSVPFGHAGCSILLSNEKGIAEITSARSVSSSLAEEFIYKNKDVKLDPRFSRDTGFKTNLAAALKTHVANPKSYDAVILNSLYTRMAGGIFSKAGFDEKQLMKDSLILKIGNTGAVHALLLLVNEIENGRKNILLVDYSNGTNLFEIKNQNSATEKHLQNKLEEFEWINSYQDYLLLRKVGNFNSIECETKEMFSSEMMNEREKESLIYLKGLKCNQCATVYYLKTTRCKKCKGEKFSDVQLSKNGSVYAFTNEHYFPTSFPPITMAVIDLEDGGRITVQQTDTMYPGNNKLEIDTKVRLVLRKMIENDGKPDYFWKAKLI